MNTRLLTALLVALFLVVVSFMMASMASPYITYDLGGDRYITVYLIAFFGYGTALTIPIAKPLAAKFGVKKSLLLSLLLLALFLFLSGLAPTYFLLIVTRFFSGAVTGPFYALLTHCLSSVTPPEKKVQIRWIFVTILVVTPVIAAAWGGTVAYLYDWRAIFFIHAPLLLSLVWTLHHFFKEIEVPALPDWQTFDWISWIFYFLATFSIAFILTTAQQLDWYRSPLLCSLAILTLFSLAYFLLRTKYRTPILSFFLLKKPLYSLSLLSLAILFAIYFGNVTLLTVWLTLDAQFTPLWVVLLLATMGIAGLFPRYLIENQFHKIHPLFFIALATIFLALSSFYTSIFNVEVNFGRIALSRILAGVGLALFLPPITQILSESYGPEKWVDTIILFQCVRNLSSGLGAAIFTIAWQRRTVFYHERLNERLNPSLFFKKAALLQVPGDKNALLGHYLERQASTLALNDVFYLMGWILCALLLILLIAAFLTLRQQKITTQVTEH